MADRNLLADLLQNRYGYGYEGPRAPDPTAIGDPIEYDTSNVLARYAPVAEGRSLLTEGGIPGFLRRAADTIKGWSPPPGPPQQVHTLTGREQNLRAPGASHNIPLLAELAGVHIPAGALNTMADWADWLPGVDRGRHNPENTLAPLGLAGMSAPAGALAAGAARRQWNRVEFTPEMRDAVREGLAAGRNGRDLAEHVGVGYNTLRRYALEEGLEFGGRPRMEVPVDQMRTLHESGIPTRAVAERLGVSQATVRQRLAEAGVNIAGPHQVTRDPAIMNQIPTMRQQGLSFNEIGQRLGLTRGQVAGMTRDLRSRGTEVLADAPRASLPGTVVAGAGVTEWPTGAAVKVGDNVFSGVTHFDALQRAVPGAIENGLFGPELMEAFRRAHGTDVIDADGFVTNLGRYVSRDEAAKLAQEKLGTNIGQWLGLDAVAYERQLARHEGRAVAPEADNALAAGMRRIMWPHGTMWADAPRASLPGTVVAGVEGARAPSGFDPLPWYHGSIEKPFERFDLSRSGQNFGGNQPGGPAYFARDRERAQMFAEEAARLQERGPPHVREAYLRNYETDPSGDALVRNADDIWLNPEIIEVLRKYGLLAPFVASAAGELGSNPNDQ